MVATSISTFLVVLSLGLCIFHALPINGAGAPAPSFSTKLIHRDSPESPLYDPTSTPFSRFRAAVHRSAHRANNFRSIPANNSRLLTAVDRKLISSTMTNYDGDYMIKFGLGVPLKETHAMVVTGSDIPICVLCNPCPECYEHKDPLFDPNNSSTNEIIMCRSDACSLLGRSPCPANSPCQFEGHFSSHSSIRGTFSRETLGFDNSDGESGISVPGILFVCAHQTVGRFNEAGIGIVSLSDSNLSLNLQLNSAVGRFDMFSYCLGKYSRMYFGPAADVSDPKAMTTTLFIGTDKLYYLDMKAVVVYGHMIMPLHFAMKKEKGTHRQGGNILMDIGTTFTFINDKILENVLNRLERIIPRPRVEAPEGMTHFDLCFNWSDPVEENEMPWITIHFAGRAKLEVMNPFILVETGILCFAVASDRHTKGNSILGNLAHSGYRTVYAPKERKLTFLPKGC